MEMSFGDVKVGDSLAGCFLKEEILILEVISVQKHTLKMSNNLYYSRYNGNHCGAIPTGEAGLNYCDWITQISPESIVSLRRSHDNRISQAKGKQSFQNIKSLCSEISHTNVSYLPTTSLENLADELSYLLVKYTT